MNIYDFYIGPDEYEIANKNGISKVTLERRIRVYGWSKEKALTTKPQKKVDKSKWYKIAEENGISKNLFFTRVNRSKWSCEKAATEPIKYTAERNRKYSDDIYKKLDINGISRELFYDRIRKGWDIERAFTEKKFTQEMKTQILIENTKNINNGFKEMQKLHWLGRSNKSERV